VCVKCKRIIDIHDPAYDQIPLPKGIEEEFSVLSKRVVILGTCKTCNQAGRRSSGPRV
jgi:Fe2+ or Zn2+ uptake regulation protein